MWVIILLNLFHQNIICLRCLKIRNQERDLIRGSFEINDTGFFYAQLETSLGFTMDQKAVVWSGYLFPDFDEIRNIENQPSGLVRTDCLGFDKLINLSRNNNLIDFDFQISLSCSVWQYLLFSEKSQLWREDIFVSDTSCQIKVIGAINIRSIWSWDQSCWKIKQKDLKVYWLVVMNKIEINLNF